MKRSACNTPALAKARPATTACDAAVVAWDMAGASAGAGDAVAEAGAETVAVEAIFAEMRWLATAMSLRAGKKIHILSDAGGVELDLASADALAEPLLHLVLNACDHGLERPDERATAGKLRAGQLSLRAHAQPDGVIIEIGDDGQGLGKDCLLHQATQAGLVAPGAALSEQQVFALAFHPGLTTTGAAAGKPRGQGLHLAHRTIHALGGRIDVASIEGVGATFTITLPTDRPAKHAGHPSPPDSNPSRLHTTRPAAALHPARWSLLRPSGSEAA